MAADLFGNDIYIFCLWIAMEFVERDRSGSIKEQIESGIINQTKA